MSAELARLDATAQADLVRDGEASPVELVEEAIGRIEALNGELNAVIHLLFESARRTADWWERGFDLLLTPTLGEPPTPLGDFAPDSENPGSPIMRSVPVASFTAFWNSTGQPAISLPLHWWSQDGLPIGVQLVAAYGREDVLIRIAAQLEQARPWADRTPVFAG